MHDPDEPMRQETGTRSWLESLSRFRQQTAAGLLVGGFLLVVATLYLLVKYLLRQPETGTWVYFVFTALLGSSLLAIGFWQYLRPPGDQWSEEEATRMLVLAVGGLTGFAVTVFGLCLGYHWWDVFSGGVESWRKEWWRVGSSILTLFGGLALMFVSLQMARTEERSSANLRRLVYGYNAVLTGLLLLAILLVLNVLTYLPVRPLDRLFAKPSDWTESSIYTLSPATKNLLASIDQPVKIYVLLPKESRLYTEVETLIGNCRAENRRLEVEYISPDLSPRKAAELIRKYQLLESEGILIVYGTEPKEEHEFINAQELFTVEPRTNKFDFQGESALYAKLTVLAEGKSRSVVYFAQGDGELDLNDSNTAVSDRGLGVLKDNLQKGNYEIKELRLDDPTLKRIPDDAQIVVIARPTRPLSTAGLEALRAYMNPGDKDAKKGKLVILLDVVADRDGNFVQTGLEKLLEQFGVSVGNERILTIPTNRFTQDALRVYVDANRLSRNKIAITFVREPSFVFYDVRPVSPKSPEANQPSSYTAETIFQNELPSFIEKPPLHPDATDYLHGLVRAFNDKEERGKELQANLNPVSVAVAVTSWAPPTGDKDPHSFMRQGNQEPRMVVFGDATWISNKETTRPGAGVNELFLSTLAWLREAPNIGKTADPKERKFFTLSASQDAVSRLEWLPGALICLGILGLGGGIWVVRRR